MLPVLSRQHGMLGMNGIRGREKDSIDIISFQDILKTLLLIASIPLAEGLPFLRVSCIAGRHFHRLASLDGIGDHT
jgi:hypothetical protein